jgi:hypothetical protein
MKKFLKITAGFFVVIIIITFAFGGGTDALVEHEMQRIENNVAEDAVKQYEIAKKNGSAIDAYVQAGVVSAAYLQANDEENYKKWKEIEAQEAKLAGF